MIGAAEIDRQRMDCAMAICSSKSQKLSSCQSGGVLSKWHVKQCSSIKHRVLQIEVNARCRCHRKCESSISSHQ